MAKILDETQAPTGRHGVRYPWDEWLDGKPRELVPGEDFKIKSASMRVLVYQAAYKRGLKVATEMHGPVGSESIRLRAYAPDAEVTE